MNKTTTNKLKIAHWNANGLRNKIEQLKNFIYEHNIDIMLINETKFTSRNNCNIQGYKTLRADRISTGTKNPGGGIAIFVKNGIPSSEITYNKNSNDFQVIGVKIKKLTVYSVYVKNNSLDTSVLDDLFKSNIKVIVAGDFNARHQIWNCNKSNVNGTSLKNYIKNRDYSLLYPDQHTFYPSNHRNKPSTLDLALIKNTSNVKIEVVNDLDSDHLPIIIDLNAKIKLNKPKTFYNYAKADWKKFRNYLTENHNMNTKLSEKREIDKAINNLINNIQQACKIAIPVVTCKPNADVLNSEIKMLIKIKK